MNTHIKSNTHRIEFPQMIYDKHVQIYFQLWITTDFSWSYPLKGSHGSARRGKFVRNCPQRWTKIQALLPCPTKYASLQNMPLFTHVGPRSNCKPCRTTYSGSPKPASSWGCCNVVKNWWNYMENGGNQQTQDEASTMSKHLEWFHVWGKSWRKDLTSFSIRSTRSHLFSVHYIL